MNPFYRLMVVALLSGTICGLLLFAVQHFTVIPLIEDAEKFEHHEHENSEWHPDEGVERAAFTALTTVLSAIGFAAILFGFLASIGRERDACQGMLWGLGAFACFHLAPALGLPPEPPGAATGDVQYRQLWWAGTVVATAIGLYLITGRKHTWMHRVVGVICLAIPHIIGAPAATEPSVVPQDLIRRFAIASLATSAVFWPLLGAVGGYVFRRLERR